MKLQCCDPFASLDKCYVCGKVVHTCERGIAVNNDYRCPLHPNDIQDNEDHWFCSNGCYDRIHGE